MTPEDRKALREALAKVKTRAGEPFDAELIGIARFQFNSLCTEDRIRRLLAALEAAERERDALKLQAQVHAQEAATQRATVHEAYRICTGGTGEPGDWNGAAPIRALRERAEAAEARGRRLREALQSIADMDQEALRADDLGRAARIASAALSDTQEPPKAQEQSNG